MGGETRRSAKTYPCNGSQDDARPEGRRTLRLHGSLLPDPAPDLLPELVKAKVDMDSVRIDYVDLMEEGSH